MEKSELMRYNEARRMLLSAVSQLSRMRHRIARIENPDLELRFNPDDFPKTETLSDILEEMEKLVKPTMEAKAILDSKPEGTMLEIIRVAHQMGIKA